MIAWATARWKTIFQHDHLSADPHSTYEGEMSHPYCTCHGSISASGHTFTQCSLCACGARMVTIEVDNSIVQTVAAAIASVAGTQRHNHDDLPEQWVDEARAVLRALRLPHSTPPPSMKGTNE